MDIFALPINRSCVETPGTGMGMLLGPCLVSLVDVSPEVLHSLKC